MKYYLKENFRFLHADGQLYDENGTAVYTYRNKNLFLPRIDLCKYGVNIGHVKKQFRWILDQYDIVYGPDHVGSLNQDLKFLGSEFRIDDLGWRIVGDIFSMNYDIYNEEGAMIATVSQEFFRLTQRFYIDIFDEYNEELIVLIVMAINQYDKDRQAAAAAAASCH